MSDDDYDFRLWLGRALKDLGRGSQGRLADHLRMDSTQIYRMKNLDPATPKDTMKISIQHYKAIVPWVRREYEKKGMEAPPPPQLADDASNDDRMPDDEFSGFTRGEYTPKTEGGIPELALRPGAGEGVFGEVVALRIGGEAYSGHKVINEWNLPEEYLRHQLGVSPNQTIVVEVNGDSMTPTFLPRDKVIVDLRHNKFSNDDGVYLISDGFNPPQIKRLISVFGSNPQRVEISSDNPSARRGVVVGLDEIAIIGRVAGRMLRM